MSHGLATLLFVAAPLVAPPSLPHDIATRPVRGKMRCIPPAERAVRKAKAKKARANRKRNR